MFTRLVCVSAFSLSLAACGSTDSTSITTKTFGAKSTETGGTTQGGSDTGGTNGSGGGFAFADGYANDNVAISTPGEEIPITARLAKSGGPGNYGIADVQVKLITSDRPDAFVIEYQGIQYTLQNTNNSAYQGREFRATSGDTDIRFYPNVVADNGQMISGWTIVSDSSSNETFVGSTVFGFETDPAFLDLRVGSAIYVGLGDIFVRHVGNGGITAGFGNAQLRVDFDRNTISGTITDIADAGGSSNASLRPLAGASATLNNGAISGNAFAGDVTLDRPSDFYLSDAATMTLSGTFYEKYGTSVGGYYSDDSATSSITGGQALITGTIAAEDAQYGQP